MARLEKRFRKLDTEGTNTLTVQDFLKMPELRDNPIVQRVVQVQALAIVVMDQITLCVWCFVRQGSDTVSVLW